MLGLHQGEFVDAVGDEREVAPIGPQLGLRANKRVRLTISLRSP
jgi:hypothetical protein